MRVLAAFVQMLLVVGAAWSPMPGLCSRALADASRATAVHDCCAGEPGPPVSPDGGGSGSCCRHDMRCDQPCHVTLVFQVQPALYVRFDRVALGVVQARGERLQGIGHAPEPRPPDLPAA